ncbi:hypothetical protein C8A05DRAFT_45883 [Staphylotrichum tortipilum]|uniref:Zn(2)-C6 fungal-type domain-containing protein n=1 Tax=Staphylotrichum tortipilum TaxID=2831512 RepID=A0AAN6MHW2_9PEZI|nr:hypothetical protein C8A05DRAFT_45883 [Staphylotrichum longicolle]
MQALPNTGGGGPMGYAQPPPPTSLPLLTLEELDAAAADFDYSAFLQDDQSDSGYLAEESSGSMTTPPLASSLSPPSTAQAERALQLLAPREQLLSPAAAAGQPRGGGSQGGAGTSSGGGGQALQKQRLERRGHTKSRRGCFNCKRRRIKCQETRPACGHCIKQGFKCEYPALPTIIHQPQHQVPIFSMQDMRCFQHFLMHCYPHHPIGSEDLWTHEVPCLSQRYEYLMHAILGYAASELMATDPSLAEVAMSHRLKAIKAIKRSLSSSAASSPPSCATPGSSPAPPLPQRQNDTLFEEGNALIATCFALTYQSVLLEDGMAEYMTFIRGIVIVAIQMYCRGARLLFGHLMGDKSKETLQPHMEGLPLIDAGWTERAVKGIAGLKPLVEGREVEGRYWELIGEMAGRLGESSWKAYLGLTDLYGWWMMLPHGQFQRLIDPTSQVALLLGSHWIALEQIMAVICDAERRSAAAKQPPQSAGAGTSSGNVHWLKYLNGQVDDEHRRYNEWPMWVEAQLDRDLGFFGRTPGI